MKVCWWGHGSIALSLLLAVTACGHRQPVAIGQQDGGAEGDLVQRDGAAPSWDLPPDGLLPDGLLPDTRTSPTPECPGGAAKQIYVVSSDGYGGQIHRFDPTTTGSGAFTLAFNLSCPLQGTPFSMAVSRGGTAYVLHTKPSPYGCTGLARVDLSSGICQKQASFKCGVGGLDLFGMGYVRDGPASAGETLFVGNIYPPVYKLATLDPVTGALKIKGSLPSAGEYTGTSSGELWGFFGHTSPVTLRRLDKQSGKVLETHDLNAIPSSVSATAVAAWGGAFYVFYNHNVYRVDSSGKVTTQVQKVAFQIVGAGTACP